MCNRTSRVKNMTNCRHVFRKRDPPVGDLLFPLSGVSGIAGCLESTEKWNLRNSEGKKRIPMSNYVHPLW